MIVALNNKCNLTHEEFTEYLTQLNKIDCQSKLILIPSFCNISLANNCKFALASQNISSRNNGAYTGEVSAQQLKSFHVKYTLVGHSERREYQKETLTELNEKVKRAFENSITPILCVGETKEERENNQVKEVIEKEITSAIKDLTEEEKQQLIIAYEPIWSIGTGVIPTIEEIEEVFNMIKTQLPTSKILYGGSANEKNISILKESKLIDGYLLGGLSLKPKELKEFLTILEN